MKTAREQDGKQMVQIPSDPGSFRLPELEGFQGEGLMAISLMVMCASNQIGALGDLQPHAKAPRLAW